MKYYSIILAICLLPKITFSQDLKDINLLSTEDSWRKEAFAFPVPFAPEIDLQGLADVRFTKGWSDADSPHFWSYAFAWYLTDGKKLSEHDLESYLQEYFDGLMKVVNKDKTLEVPLTNALLSATNKVKGQNDYKGKIKFYDAFFTQEMLTLHIKAEYKFCKEHDRNIYFFKLSPQTFENDAWLHIDKTQLRDNLCLEKLDE